MADEAGVRADLLRRCLEHLGDEGLDGLRLRRLAAAVGTSHRMLLYYFGSREELLAAVVTEVEARQRRELEELGTLPAAASFEEMCRALWQRLRRPAMHPSERLFFELYVAGLRGEAYARPFLDAAIDPWLDPLARTLEHHGVPPGRAPTLARVSLAAVRGLLLDLLASGDVAAVDAAAEEVFALLASRIDPGPHGELRPG